MSKIRYKDVMDLGFKEHFEIDQVYMNEHGFQYTIIEKKINKYLNFSWEKDTKRCELVRVDSRKKGNIQNRMEIKTLEQLKELNDFFFNVSGSEYCFTGSTMVC